MLSTPARIDTSSIDTGSSARISFGLTARAWAKPTRWRSPPLISYGNLLSILGFSPTLSKTRSASALAFGATQLRSVQGEVAHHPVRDPEHRVERAERVLEDDRDLAPVPEQVLAASAGCCSGRPR